MKSTKIKISVSQDGLLPQESIEVSTIEFPSLPKKLLRALGFEKVDNTTFVGVMPVFVNLADKDQEIEVELGVSMPEMREKIIELFQKTLSHANSDASPEPETKPKRSRTSTKRTTKKAASKTKKTTKSASTKKTSTRAKKSSPKKTTAKSKTTRKTTSKKTKG